jgi:4-amino-4-deoxy-L-arabinose transferase-like glycosyltransferase
MNEKFLKYLFFLLISLLLIIMLVKSRDAGVNCDEVLHYNHSVEVLNYFTSGGKDTSVLDTPESHLKYYGQSYDNIATVLIRLFKIDDIYAFRHLMSSLAGWLTILVTAFFAIWLAGYEAGIAVLFLFALSPTFIGHSQNNLKDIPFALGYISGIYFTLRLLSSEKKFPVFESIMLTLSIAFCMSIRAGGIILICYFFLFLLILYSVRYVKEGRFILSDLLLKLLIAAGIIVSAWFLSLILWPYGLQDPLRNPIESYKYMAGFPATFREIFEGKVEWTDFMPWYYLIKYMLITIPLIVLAGLTAFVIFSLKIMRSDNNVKYTLLVITLLFPPLFVIYKDSNLYSGWRQLLFIYPGIVILAAAGLVYIFRLTGKKYLKWILILALVYLSIHPAKFLITNYRYAYIYYNQIVKGLKGAYGNYETDYYFVGQREASEWLINYIEKNGISSSVIVGTNFSAEWFFRNYPNIRNIYFRNEERSMFDWDYAIVTNRYIAPFRLKNKLWPPDDALKVVYADRVPICAVIERKSKVDLHGYKALQENRLTDAIGLYAEAVEKNYNDEMIFFNFAVALNRSGNIEKADSLLRLSLDINPAFEPALMFLGNIAVFRGDSETAEKYYKTLITINRKYFEAYVELAKLMIDKDVQQARELLRSCITINPKYKPAIIALADSYRISDPDVAKKYDELIKTIN